MLLYICCYTYVVIHMLLYICCYTYVVIHMLLYICCYTYVVKQVILHNHNRKVPVAKSSYSVFYS